MHVFQYTMIKVHSNEKNALHSHHYGGAVFLIKCHTHLIYRIHQKEEEKNNRPAKLIHKKKSHLKCYYLQNFATNVKPKHNAKLIKSISAIPFRSLTFSLCNENGFFTK